MMAAFKEIFLSQFRMFFRDRVTLTITIILPLFLGTFLGLMFSRQDIQEVRVVIVDEDRTDSVRLMINGIIEGCKDTSLKVRETDRADALNLPRYPTAGLSSRLVSSVMPNMAQRGQSPRMSLHSRCPSGTVS